MCCGPETASAMSSCPTKTSSTSSASVARIDSFRPGSRSHSTQLSSRVQPWAVATNDFTRPLVERAWAVLVELGFIPAGAEAPLLIAMRATDPPRHLLYFVRDPWPRG